MQSQENKEIFTERLQKENVKVERQLQLSYMKILTDLIKSE